MGVIRSFSGSEDSPVGSFSPPCGDLTSISTGDIAIVIDPQC